MKQSRRSFLTSAGAVLAGTALTACGDSDSDNGSSNETPITFDRSTDVLVLGTGFAGLSAAISAHDAGAQVLVLEKTDEAHAGGGSRVSGQGIMIPDVNYGAQFFANMAADHMSFYKSHPEVIEAWVTELNKNLTWVPQIIGKPLAPLPNGQFAPEEIWLDPDKTTRAYGIDNGQGTGLSFNAVLWNPFKKAFDSRSIEVLYETPATKLLTDSKGNVLGVTATSNGKSINIQAKKGVILATGGYEFNDVLKENYLHGPIYGFGNPWNTGDGVRMAQELGADLWHMNDAQGPIMLVFLNGYKDASGNQKYLDPNIPAEVPFTVSLKGSSYIYVDKTGKRFMNEGKPAQHGRGLDELFFYDGSGQVYIGNPTPKQTSCYPRNPAWFVFDESVRTAGAIGHTLGAAGLAFGWTGFPGNTTYSWSTDNSAEVANGVILKADDLASLEAQMGVPPGNLQATVAKWNGDMTASPAADTMFGRTSKLVPLASSGPYYAMRYYPGMVNTQGGPRRNQNAQIVRPDDTPIPRLYSAGELGSIYTWHYNGGGNISECIAYGRLAGEKAAAETPL